MRDTILYEIDKEYPLQDNNNDSYVLDKFIVRKKFIII